MRLFLSFLAPLLAVAIASPASIKRQSSNYVTDGGFESVPKSDEGKFNFNGGGWTFTGSATLFINDNTQEDTPFGKKFAQIIDNGLKSTTGSFSQQLTGLPTGTLTLTYAFREWIPPYTTTCFLTVTLGSQRLDLYTIRPLTMGEVNFRVRAKSFRNTASSGTLTYKIVCDDDYGYDIHFDQISVSK